MKYNGKLDSFFRKARIVYNLFSHPIKSYNDVQNVESLKEKVGGLGKRVEELTEKSEVRLYDLCGLANGYEAANRIIEKRNRLIRFQKINRRKIGREKNKLVVDNERINSEHEKLYSEIDKYFQSHGIGTKEEKEEEANLFLTLFLEYNIEMKKIHQIFYRKGLDGLKKIHKSLRRRKAKKRLKNFRKKSN